MDIQRIIMDIKVQLIVAEYKFAQGNTAGAEADLLHIPNILKYTLPPQDPQPDEKPHLI